MRTVRFDLEEQNGTFTLRTTYTNDETGEKFVERTPVREDDPAPDLTSELHFAPKKILY